MSSFSFNLTTMTGTTLLFSTCCHGNFSRLLHQHFEYKSESLPAVWKTELYSTQYAYINVDLSINQCII